MKRKKQAFLRLCGGCGNQFFMLAAAYTFAKRNNYNLFIDEHSGFLIDKYRRKSSLRYFNNNFNSKFSIFFFPGLFQFFRFIFSFKILQDFFSLKYIRQSQVLMNSDLRITEIYNYNIVLIDGYWQSEQYFVEYKEEIIKIFNDAIQRNAIHREFNITDNHVIIHFRSFSETESNAALIDKNYYVNAIEHIKKIIINPVFVIISDDIRLASIYFGNMFNSDVYVNNMDEISDLYFISRFKNIITSNSTFCWWAAYISKFNFNQSLILAYDKSLKSKFNSWGFKNLYPTEWVLIS